MQRIRKTYTVQDAVVSQIEDGPDEVRDQYGLETTLQEVLITEGGFQVKVVK